MSGSKKGRPGVSKPHFRPRIPESGGQDEPLEPEAIAEALIAAQGNVTAAAKTLSLNPMRLRAFVKAKRELSAIQAEIMEQAVDASVQVLWGALADEGSFQNRFYGAKEWLKSEMGRRRGFGWKPAGVTVINSGRAAAPTTIEIKWLEPPQEAPGLRDPMVIEGEKAGDDG
jgi:plasmid maintenance system antidote protein VapI